MTEGTIKQKLVKMLRESGLTVTRHEDRSTSGIPDIEVTGHGVTTWWEVKYGKPGAPWKTKGIQHLHLLKLAAKGMNGWYIIFEEMPVIDIKWHDYRVTAIAHPRSIGKTRTADKRDEWNTVTGERSFNYDWVVGEINLVHLQRRVL